MHIYIHLFGKEGQRLDGSAFGWDQEMETLKALVTSASHDITFVFIWQHHLPFGTWTGSDSTFRKRWFEHGQTLELLKVVKLKARRGFS